MNVSLLAWLCTGQWCSFQSLPWLHRTVWARTASMPTGQVGQTAWLKAFAKHEWWTAQNGELAFSEWDGCTVQGGQGLPTIWTFWPATVHAMWVLSAGRCIPAGWQTLPSGFGPIRMSRLPEYIPTTTPSFPKNTPWVKLLEVRHFGGHSLVYHPLISKRAGMTLRLTGYVTMVCAWQLHGSCWLSWCHLGCMVSGCGCSSTDEIAHCCQRDKQSRLHKTGILLQQHQCLHRHQPLCTVLTSLALVSERTVFHLTFWSTSDLVPWWGLPAVQCDMVVLSVIYSLSWPIALVSRSCTNVVLVDKPLFSKWHWRFSLPSQKKNDGSKSQGFTSMASTHSTFGLNKPTTWKELSPGFQTTTINKPSKMIFILGVCFGVCFGAMLRGVLRGYASQERHLPPIHI